MSFILKAVAPPRADLIVLNQDERALSSRRRGLESDELCARGVPTGKTVSRQYPRNDRARSFNCVANERTGGERRLLAKIIHTTATMTTLAIVIKPGDFVCVWGEQVKSMSENGRYV